jgi:hypothetical protein
VIGMPEAFHTGSDEEPFADDWPAALRAQGKPVPKTLLIGGAMRYRPVPG